MELRLKTPTKYLFSSFETVHWYAASGLMDELKSKLKFDSCNHPGCLEIYNLYNCCLARVSS